MAFLEKWLEAVERKNSVLCAGLDPAIYEMGRGAKGLPEGADKREWSLRYVEAISPFAAAVKPNIQYWKGPGDMETLREVCDLAHKLGMVTIIDSKLADIGSTNDAGMFYSREKDFDAVTLAPYAGNMEEASGQAENNDVGLITMCLMSNPEYEIEKNKLVVVDSTIEYDSKDIINFEGTHFVRQYVHLAQQADKHGLDGVVIGAPSTKNHIQESEIELVRKYVGDDMLVLLPGVGAQGGEANVIWKYFGNDRVIVNVSRALMFPESGTHDEVAKHYMKMLNELRKN